ncbi:MAG: radical SAM protein [Thermodesulfobacteriota bacterium]
MKILFVIKDIEYIDPMGIMLLSALAKEGRPGRGTAINVLADGNLRETIGSFKPDVVAFSAKTGEHKYYVAANATVKGISGEIATVIGGPHPTFFPEMVKKYDFDALCVGEGDDAWPELLDRLEGGQPFDDIPNIVTKGNYLPGQPPLIRPRRRDLDSLPHLDRELVYGSTRLGRFPMRSFMVGRGCPFRCTYCFNHQYNDLYKEKGPVLARMSVGRVVEELKETKERYDTQFIKFYDDVFLIKDDEWLDEFAEVFPREVGLPFHCLMRADLLTGPVLKKLKKAGLASLSMSIESGNARVRDEILKRDMSTEDMTKAFDLCRENGVPTFSNTIFAIPGTTIKEDIESLDMNLRCRVDLGEFPIFVPYPGTELARYAMDKGYFDGDFDSLHMSYQNTSPLSSFDEKEKLMQTNLSLLATVCLWMPWARDLIVNRLIKLPLTGLYFVLYYLVKAYLVKTRIYPMSFSISNFVRSVYESFVLERFKHYEDSLPEEGEKKRP